MILDRNYVHMYEYVGLLANTTGSFISHNAIRLTLYKNV
jgi:hypothetical protein